MHISIVAGKMLKKSMLIETLMLVLLATVFLSMPQAKTPDLPPGVTADMWISLSDNSGILLSSNGRFFTGKDKVSRGTLFVKMDNVWHRFYLDPGPPVIMPVK